MCNLLLRVPEKQQECSWFLREENEVNVLRDGVDRWKENPERFLFPRIGPYLH
jgi:hypothetical protein